MITILGTVYRVIYASPKNNFCVFIVRDFQNEDHPCAGNIEAPKVGDELEVKGTMVVHKKYGRQIRVESMQRIIPDTMAGARRYLENLGVKGLGPKTLDKILDYFNESILDILSKYSPNTPDNPQQVAPSKERIAPFFIVLCPIINFP